MNRRNFLGSAVALAGGTAITPGVGVAAIPKMKVRRIRYYQPQRVNPTFNQSNRIVTVETDSGITGIGEGGSKDMMDQLAPMLIGEDPSRIDHLWQMCIRDSSVYSDFTIRPASPEFMFQDPSRGDARLCQSNNARAAPRISFRHIPWLARSGLRTPEFVEFGRAIYNAYGPPLLFSRGWKHVTGSSHFPHSRKSPGDIGSSETRFSETTLRRRYREVT